jgi:hypothetical protein
VQALVDPQVRAGLYHYNGARPFAPLHADALDEHKAQEVIGAIEALRQERRA